MVEYKDANGQIVKEKSFYVRKNGGLDEVRYTSNLQGDSSLLPNSFQEWIFLDNPAEYASGLRKNGLEEMAEMMEEVMKEIMNTRKP